MMTWTAVREIAQILLPVLVTLGAGGRYLLDRRDRRRKEEAARVAMLDDSATREVKLEAARLGTVEQAKDILLDVIAQMDDAASRARAEAQRREAHYEERLQECVDAARAARADLAAERERHAGELASRDRHVAALERTIEGLRGRIAHLEAQSGP